MARIGYFIKNVRENDNPTAVTTALELDTTFRGTLDFGGQPYYMFYQWPTSKDANSTNGLLEGATAAGKLMQAFPNLAQVVQREPSDGFDLQHLTSELQSVYTSSRVTGSSYGDDFRLRVGKRIYILGYAYSGSDAIDPTQATITWKD